MRVPFAASVVCASCALVSTATADEPFTLTAQGGPLTASASGHNAVDLVSNLIESEAEFTPLFSTAITGSLRYGEMEDAVLFTRNGSGTSATLTIPSTGFTRTFNAANEDELEEQIEDFFKEDGADAYADFLREVARQTSLGVNDGNPLATTATLADLGFYRFGYRVRIPGDAPIRLAGGWDVRLLGGVSATEAFDGWFAGIGLGKNWRLGDRVGITWANNLRYRDVEGASVYQTGTTIGVPIALITSGDDSGLSWHITPAFVGGFGGSWDLAAGGFLAGGQLTSSLALRAGGFTFVVANQIGFYEGLPIEISDFRFETDTSQRILKNGVQVIRDLGDDAYVDAGLALTNLLDDAFIEDYVSADVGVTLRLGDRSGLRLGYHGDYSSDFDTHGGNATLFFSY
ncbi:MAG TPA: hypothetical protein VGR35_15125 [Tepidisphaeraceae bacterium]|nr:hypothetical protein [Tepidisphaeraceae bacterium]